jgi:hypothetical protein
MTNIPTTCHDYNNHHHKWISTVLDRLLFTQLQISFSEQGDTVVCCAVTVSVLEVLELVMGAAIEPKVMLAFVEDLCEVLSVAFIED